jgi:hypothetical protein
MFLLHCDHCGRRELRGPRSLSTDHDGAFVATCRVCGTTSVVAGRRPTTVTAEPATATTKAIPTAA